MKLKSASIVAVLSCLSFVSASFAIMPSETSSAEITKPNAKPNIVLVITDDQGYGDLGCTGNPIIKTPEMDRLAGESVCLTDYHVAPTCSPTRCSLITGHWTNRTGVWHTINGRSMLRANEVTLGQLLKDNGYTTGMFGKWHLGDNYPYRPEDRGFDEVYRHGGGGVGQTPDVWDNSYFDGAYFHNGKIESAKGFCTDVFFEQGNQFITRCVKNSQPFFAYIATNAPHGPLHTPQKYLDMYANQNERTAAFFGMITNIDDNIGKTRQLLKDLGVYENTIFIFTTDNGTASGEKVFNAGMRGKKGSPYDGGHRVPFFFHWPAAKFNQKMEIPNLTHAVDIVPTIMDIVEGQIPAGLKFDGRSLLPLLAPADKIQWPARMLITDSQRVRDPIKWKASSVMSERFRLINGKQLYDIQADPGQQNDIASQNPAQVEKMREFYEAWWAELEPTFSQTTEIYLGHPNHPRVSLTAHDWIHNNATPWNQGHIRATFINRKRRNRNQSAPTAQDQKPLTHNGHWAVKVLNPGRYQIELRRWPAEADHPINASLPSGQDVPGASRAFRTTPGTAIKASTATLRIDGRELETKPVDKNAKAVQFVAELSEGSHQLSPIFNVERGVIGAFYVIVTKLD